MQPPPPSEYSYSASPRRHNNSWIWVIVAIVVVCGCGGIGLLGAVLFPVFAQAKIAANRAQCMSNIKQDSAALLIYAADNDDHIPQSKWMEVAMSGVGSEVRLTCPVVRQHGGEYGYAINSKLTTTKKPDAATTVLIFETNNLARNASGDPSVEGNPDRHGKGRTESYVDG